MSWSGGLRPGPGGSGVKCGHPVLAETQERGQKRLEAQDWGQAATLVCWGLSDRRSGPGLVGLRQPGWNEEPPPGCAAGAGSAGSAAGGPSSRRTSAAPCERTGGQRAAADAGIPAVKTPKHVVVMFLYCNEAECPSLTLHIRDVRVWSTLQKWQKCLNVVRDIGWFQTKDLDATTSSTVLHSPPPFLCP